MQKNEIRKKLCTIIGIVSFALVFLLVVFLHSSVRLLRDDFFYYPFARNGLMNFIYSMGHHYLNTNGRLFVHSICSILLAGNLWLFRIFNIASISLSMWLCAKLVAKDNIKSMYLFFISFFVFWLSGNLVITETALWISGTFNYVFPMLMLFAYIYLLMNNKSKSGEIWCIIFGFLSSLTTEISSLITLILTAIILIKRYKTLPKIPKLYILGVVLQVIGFMFLVMSPGMSGRLNGSGNTGMGQMLLRSGINFNTFVQMSFENNGIGLPLSFALLFSGICAYKVLNKKALSVLLVVSSAFPILTMTGVIYFTWAYLLLAVTSILLLVWYGILQLKNNDNITILALFCFIISYGIMCVSGIVGYRMLFWPGICLLIVGLRALSLLDLNRGILCTICVLLSVVCSANTVKLIAVGNENARVWDKNQEIIESYSGGETIEMENVPDELFFQGAVPVDNNFGDHYLKEFGIPEEVQAYSVDKQYYTVVDENDTVVTDKAVKRNGTYYLCYDPLLMYLGVGNNWIYDNVETVYNDKLYRFHYGANSVMNNYIGGTGVKLSSPIRIIDSWIQISVEDANNIFNTKLEIKQ